MERFIFWVDSFTAWAGKAFAWCILLLTAGVGYEVFVRYAIRDPTSWAFDISYMMYGTLFMMAGAYALSRDSHVRGDVIYRLWKPKVQAAVESFSAARGVQMSVRIGLHFGPAIMEQGRIFGDTVNMAARMVGIAQAGLLQKPQP